MSRAPDCAWVRGYVLNSLEHGPVRVSDLIRIGAAEFGFTHGEIQAAGEHWGHRSRAERRTLLDAPRKPICHLVGQSIGAI
jgi:hypothetical protein